MAHFTDKWIRYEVNIDAEYAQAAGEFIVNWGALETELDFLFPVIFRLNATHSTCISANLGTKAKIEMLQSGLSMIAKALPEDLVEKLHEELQFAADYSGKYRNLLAHGRPDIDFEDENGKTFWSWTRTSARKQLQITWPDPSPQFWIRASNLVSKLAEGMYTSAWKLTPYIYDISEKDWDQLCELPNPKE